MTPRSTISLIVAILLAIVSDARAQVGVPDVILERPAEVKDLIARLKTTRPFAALEDRPISCRPAPNGNNCSCQYQPAGVRITVHWKWRTQQPATVTIEKSEPLAAPPFAWTDVATSLHRLCPRLTAEQASTMAAEAMNKLAAERWIKCEESFAIRCVLVPREMDGATRWSRARGKCDLALNETTQATTIRSRLQVEIPGTVPPRLGPGSC